MDPESIKRQLAEKQQAYGTRVADYAKTADQYNPATDPEVMGLRSNQSEKLKELFAHDTQLADVYMPPPQVPQGEQSILPPETLEQIKQPRLSDQTIGMKA